MASLNKIILIGNLGSSPEMRVTPTGSGVTSFSLAVNKVSVDAQGNTKKVTDWFRVKTWNKLAETCNQYLSKGKMVYVEGSIHSSEYEKEGIKRQAWEVTADRVVFLSPSDAAPRPQGVPQTNDEHIGEPPPVEEELFQ
jgi:single-strand DNA-binding protein